MATMSYNTLGNLAYYDTAGNGPQSGWGLSNTGPFANLQAYYWSGLENVANNSGAWGLNFNYGNQFATDKLNNGNAWAVRSGDVSAVPAPAAVWLFGSGLIGLLGMARRRRR